jgi:hypothetical protein
MNEADTWQTRSTSCTLDTTSPPMCSRQICRPNAKYRVGLALSPEMDHVGRGIQGRTHTGSIAFRNPNTQTSVIVQSDMVAQTTRWDAPLFGENSLDY